LRNFAEVLLPDAEDVRAVCVLLGGLLLAKRHEAVEASITAAVSAFAECGTKVEIL
jgi:hypothetical protein